MDRKDVGRNIMQSLRGEILIKIELGMEGRIRYAICLPFSRPLSLSFLPSLPLVISSSSLSLAVHPVGIIKRDHRGADHL